ncbi:uncharacterized protein LOC110243771 [Exaiptasia diaphana]|uniref:ShKT domain-containing protein n=1 Tax=Exaiptasia diaphana TaxID=2652724 RepID=A0A913XK41_EXADI|nr:uncharacterized protein LOC110243771 [Exaiptasia diaphana]KXJ11386.1 hypothetical protein AC249_AIPGENE8043 [Exaiptasia diaphana]
MAILALSLFVFMLIMNTLPGTDSACPVSFVKKGCYKDEDSNRRLPDLLLNGRGDVNWANWNTFIQGFICDCANTTLSKGYKYFGIQFYAECWGGDVTEAMMQSMESNDKSPDGCVNTAGLGSCSSESEMCVGKEWANYVYEVEIPTTKPPEDCSDKNENCQQWKEWNLCAEKYPKVLEQCPKSCNLCTK